MTTTTKGVTIALTISDLILLVLAITVLFSLLLHPDPGSLVNVRTLGAKSLPIQEVFEAFFRSYITS